LNINPNPGKNISTLHSWMSNIINRSTEIDREINNISYTEESTFVPGSC
jgi:hypothetical protein